MSEKRKYDATVARIAGNIAGILEAERPYATDEEMRVAARAVALARAIVAEVERTEPVVSPASDPQRLPNEPTP